MADLTLMLLVLVVFGLVARWVNADETEYSDHDPDDWP